jgi:hypothetical protein
MQFGVIPAGLAVVIAPGHRGDPAHAASDARRFTEDAAERETASVWLQPLTELSDRL